MNLCFFSGAMMFTALSGIRARAAGAGVGPQCRLECVLGGSDKLAKVLGSFKSVASVLGLGTNFCVYSSRPESWFLTALQYTPLVFKSAKVTHLPGDGPLGWGAHYGAQNPHSSGRIL